MLRRFTARRPSRDQVATTGGAFVFAISLGLVSVVIPLAALRAGYSGAEVGVLVAVAALSQMAMRSTLGVVMRYLPDWTLVAGAAATLAMSCLVVALSTAVVPFVVGQLLQGVARACFWTGSQTHAVRTPRSSTVSALATVNLASSTGLLVGPVLGGAYISGSGREALLLGAAFAAVGVVPASLLTRLPPFVPPIDRPRGGVWRRPGVSAGCWAGVTTGAWRGLLGSYVPLALDHARHSSSTIGALVAAANAAGLVGSGLVGRLHRGALARGFLAGTMAAGGATALIALGAGTVATAAALLVVSGLGAGALQTLGPAVATEAVHAEERGEAIAAAGTFRAGALLVAPLGVAGLLAVVPLAGAFAVVGVLMLAPVARVGGLERHLHGSAPG
jgi:MFS family permease